VLFRKSIWFQEQSSVSRPSGMIDIFLVTQCHHKTSWAAQFGFDKFRFDPFCVSKRTECKPESSFEPRDTEEDWTTMDNESAIGGRPRNSFPCLWLLVQHTVFNAGPNTAHHITFASSFSFIYWQPQTTR